MESRHDAGETGGYEMTDVDTEREDLLDSLRHTHNDPGAQLGAEPSEAITVDPVAEAHERAARRERLRSRIAFGAVVAVALGIAAAQSFPQWGPTATSRVSEQLSKVSKGPTAAAAATSKQQPAPTVELQPMHDLNLALGASAEASRTARSTEIDGVRTYYKASNVLDDDASTAWRAVGGATNKELLLTFNTRVKVTSVGLINGFVGDQYLAQRRIKQVTWIFDNGMTRTQFFSDDTQRMQSLFVGPIATKTLRLRIDETTEPGTDSHSDSAVSWNASAATEDYTAISDVRVMGSFCTVNRCEAS